MTNFMTIFTQINQLDLHGIRTFLTNPWKAIKVQLGSFRSWFFRRIEETSAGECHGCHVTDCNLTWTERGVSRHQGHGPDPICTVWWLDVRQIWGDSWSDDVRQIWGDSWSEEANVHLLHASSSLTSIKLTKTEAWPHGGSVTFIVTLSLPRLRLQVTFYDFRNKDGALVMNAFADIELHCIWRPYFTPGFESNTSNHYQCIFTEQ